MDACIFQLPRPFALFPSCFFIRVRCKHDDEPRVSGLAGLRLRPRHRVSKAQHSDSPFLEILLDPTFLDPDRPTSAVVPADGVFFPPGEIPFPSRHPGEKNFEISPGIRRLRMSLIITAASFSLFLHCRPRAIFETTLKKDPLVAFEQTTPIFSLLPLAE